MVLDWNLECVYFWNTRQFCFWCEYQFLVFFRSYHWLDANRNRYFLWRKIALISLEGKRRFICLRHFERKARDFFLIKIELATMHDKLLKLNKSSWFINRKCVLGRCSQATFCSMENSSKNGSKVYQTAAVSRICLLFFFLPKPVWRDPNDVGLEQC